MNNKLIKIGILLLIIVLGFVTVVLSKSSQTSQNLEDYQGGLEDNLHALSIEYMRKQTYPGSDITIEQTLPPGRSSNLIIEDTVILKAKQREDMALTPTPLMF